MYSGSRRQRGGGILGAIKSFVLPIFKSFGRKAIDKGKSAALGLANDMIRDKMMGRDMKEAFKENVKHRALNFGKDLISEGIQSSRSATKRQVKSRTTRKGVRRPAKKGAGFSRKRRASSAFMQRKKRRRLNPHRRLKRKVKRRVKRRRRNF